MRVLPAHSLMKLFCEVAEAACPSSAPRPWEPSEKEPVWIALSLRVVESAALLLPPPWFPPLLPWFWFPPLLPPPPFLFCARARVKSAAALRNVLETIVSRGTVRERANKRGRDKEWKD